VKDILLNLWDEAMKIEFERIKSLKSLYEELVVNTQKMFPAQGEEFK
jgi:hypothetical protein